MSQWTHITGIVRFESYNSNVWPVPPNQAKLLMEEVALVNSLFQRLQPPAGSEGPLQTDALLTNRGPTVVVTGDLRDFGRAEVDGVLTWVKECVALVEKVAHVFLRDVSIRCSVECVGEFMIVDLCDDVHDDEIVLVELQAGTT